MQEFLSKINDFVAKNQRFATATVTQTWGSGPRPIGSMMLIGEDGTMSGSVSGGCVEGAVIKLAAQVLRENTPKLVSFGVSDDEAWSVGLSCGGSIEVFIEPFLGFSEPKMWEILRGCLEHNQGAILLTKLTEKTLEHQLILADGTAINTELVDFSGLVTAALDTYQQRKTKKIVTEDNDTWFAQIFPPKHKLVIIGAAHITVDLVHLAHYFGFETTVIDPRGVFANKTDFPTQPNALHVDWPAEILPQIKLDAYTYAVLLTHDPKIDDQALHILLRSNVAYIGALGSKKTHEKRVKRLTEAGFSSEEIGKIDAPVGVNINAKSAREIAMSIIGALIKAKNEYL
jgi:xanthine dehydrogenase accessory factor